MYDKTPGVYLMVNPGGFTCKELLVVGLTSQQNVFYLMDNSISDLKFGGMVFTQFYIEFGFIRITINGFVKQSIHNLRGNAL